MSSLIVVLKMWVVYKVTVKRSPKELREAMAALGAREVYNGVKAVGSSEADIDRLIETFEDVLSEV